MTLDSFFQWLISMMFDYKFMFLIVADGAAARAGVQQGDRIIKVCIVYTLLVFLKDRTFNFSINDTFLNAL